MNLHAQHVSYVYPGGVQALEAVELAVSSGESLAILGPNGAGKTTLVKLFNGLLRPSTGKLIVGGWHASQKTVAELSTRCGLAFQDPNQQLFERSVRAELAFGPRNLGWPESAIEAAVDHALELFELEQHANRHPYELVASSRKLVSIAAVYAMQTPIVVLDEPTAGLDVSERALIGTAVAELRAAGRTTVIVTHDIEFAARHCERAIILTRGRMAADGPVEQVLADSEMLTATQLEAPQLIRLSRDLGLAGNPLSVDQFLRAWAQQRRGGS